MQSHCNEEELHKWENFALTAQSTTKVHVGGMQEVRFTGAISRGANTTSLKAKQTVSAIIFHVLS